MCWFSIEYTNQIEEAKTGQRLGIKQMHWHSNWVVRETELDAPRPLSGLPGRSDQGPVSVLRKSASVAPLQHRGRCGLQNVKTAEEGRL